MATIQRALFGAQIATAIAGLDSGRGERRAERARLVEQLVVGELDVAVDDRDLFAESRRRAREQRRDRARRVV